LIYEYDNIINFIEIDFSLVALETDVQAFFITARSAIRVHETKKLILLALKVNKPCKEKPT